MTDVNLLAVAAVQETIRRGVPGAARVVAGDVYDGLESGDRFDLIVSNPPFHQGKAVDYGMPQRLIDEAAAQISLRPGDWRSWRMPSCHTSVCWTSDFGW